MHFKLPFSSLAFLIAGIFLAFQAQSQTKIEGHITDQLNEPLTGVNILLKGTVMGTITDLNGYFTLSVQKAPPFTLQVSYIGFAAQEINITKDQADLSIVMEEQTLLGQEIVVSASRIEESILESPVSIEKMDILDIQNTASDDYYKAIGNLRGVDMTTSSINFQIINTRGFGSTGNTRFVQLIDGMDTQAPALNFPIGNLNGPTPLDVESVELIPGAASALYGPNAFNGVLLLNSKNPFDYQGLSFYTKTGVNHIGSNADQGIAPVLEGALRYAKSFNDKFAFKVNFSYMRADDWHGTDDTDREIFRKPKGFDFNPGADRLHYMGDEASVNIAIFPLSTAWMGLAGSGSNVYEPGLAAKDYALAGDLPAHVVSVTPYEEKYLIDYGAENIKGNVGLYYRINEKLELSYLLNAGYGTSIYTGAQRYSLNNFNIFQHRLQLRSDNFYLRTYGTFENSGDSYITEFLAKRVMDQSSLFGSVTNWLGAYGLNYLSYLYGEGLAPGEIQGLSETQRINMEMAAHQYAREQTNTAYRFEPGTEAFEKARTRGMENVVPLGPKFNDNTRMYQTEAQYDFKNEIDFIALQAGASFRLYDLNSNGTIFPDTLGNNITISEFGAYLQAAKPIANDKIKLSGSVRYDKNENFKGQVNPRISTVFKLAKNHNLRFSYQTGFRIPTTQGQHIDLNILSARLLGGLPQYYEAYNITQLSSKGIPLGYEGYSVQDYSTAVFEAGARPGDIFNPANLTMLKPFTEAKPVEPEKVKAFEIGYKSLINNSFMIDLSWYYNIYNNFIAGIRVRKAEEFTTIQALDDPDGYGYSYNPDPALEGTPNYATLLNGTNLNTYQIYSNINHQITSQGLALGLTYQLLKGYNLGTNYSWNIINNVPEGFIAEFNTPEHKVNFTFGNRKLTENLGFNVSYRWQSEFWWESSFTLSANGSVPAFSTMDAQVSYKLKNLKSQIKLGGSNIMNKKYFMSLGGPNIGAMYYVTLTFDELLR